VFRIPRDTARFLSPGYLMVTCNTEGDVAKGRITKRSVDALRPFKTADNFLWDEELRGFGIRTKPSGAKSFLISYYAPERHRKRERLTLGQYPNMTVDEARKEARRQLGRVAHGDNPAAERQETRRALRDDTVANLLDEYLEYGRAHFKARTMELYEGIARLYVLPAFGKLLITEVGVREVDQLHRKLKRKPVMANRVVRFVKSFYYWLEKRDLYTGRNPASRVELFKEKPAERYLSDEELSKIGEALRIAETAGLRPAPYHRMKPSNKRKRNAGMLTSEPRRADPTAVAALRFLLQTGWREGEALGLRWSEVDMTTGLVTLPDTKTGKSQRILGAPTLEVLRRVPRIVGSPYVFPGKDPSKPLESVHRLWTAVRHAAGLDDVRLHDLRHTVASKAGGMGVSLFVIGKILGHRSIQSTERYAHLADDTRKTTADAVSQKIQDALEHSPKDTPVIQLRATK
jgi:integrase